MGELYSSDEQDVATLFLNTELVEPRELKAATTTAIDFDGLLQEPLLLHEDLAKGCGGQLWPAGVRLAKYLLRNKRDEMRDSSMQEFIELGSGGGLTGLAVAVGCSPKQTLHITDQEVMLDLMHRNIDLNKLQQRVKATVYDWGTPTPAELPTRPDIILAADCVYFEPAFEPLRQTMEHLIGETTKCYFCFKKRRRADLHFMKAAKKTFSVTEITDDADYQEFARDNVHLYVITRKKA